MKKEYNLLVVCGPTASGKTGLTVRLADALDGEVISADSRQVYRNLDIGSGKDLHEYTIGNRTISYHLIDIADPVQIYTLYHYQHDCYRTIAKVHSRNNLPILCGGSGLYIEAVLRGYALPNVPEDRSLRTELMKRQKNDLTEQLLSLSSKIYQATDLSSKKRIVRAIEVAEYNKKNGILFQAPDEIPKIIPFILCTRWKRDLLHERIGHRLEKRLSEGMVEEVIQLRQSGVPDERLMMLGMEYKFITLYLKGEMDRETMVEKLRHAICQLAKRQETWFRGMERRGSVIHWVDEADYDSALSMIGDRFSEKDVV